MRLIDANALIAFMRKGWRLFPSSELRHTCDITDVENAPTIDAVPVVRCKDCKWYEESKNPEIYPIRFCYRLRNDNGVRVGYNCDENDFCSHGERREDERTVSHYGDNKLIETIVIDERREDETEPGIYKTDMEEQL